ncbi:MAG: hypothetical protein ACSLEN_06670 [Candidatus Malihini olakiniferum]
MIGRADITAEIGSLIQIAEQIVQIDLIAFSRVEILDDAKVGITFLLHKGICPRTANQDIVPPVAVKLVITVVAGRKIESLMVVSNVLVHILHRHTGNFHLLCDIGLQC